MRASAAHRDLEARRAAVLQPRVLGDDEQAADRQQRALQAEPEPLGDGTARAQPGEGSRPVAEGDGVEIVQRQAAFAQQFVDGRQQ
jgi:hypothetical protein